MATLAVVQPPMTIDSSPVQLIFAGEVLDGFSPADVKQRLAQRLKLDEARLRSLFCGQRVVLKRGLSAETAAHWVAQFREMGARLHIVHTPAEAAPAATPATAPVPIAPAPLALTPSTPAPAPIAVNTPPVTEEITCPSCGERQPKRILCRACACDMPRGIAAREEEAAAERARRNEERLARRGGHRAAVAGAPSRRPSGFAASRVERIGADDEDAPLFSLSFDGRIGRMRNFLGGLLILTTIVWLAILAALAPSSLTLVLLLIGLAFTMVWGIRLTVLRLHDVNRSGWWVLLMLVPTLGNLASLALLLWPGDGDDNEFGPPPSQDGSLPAIAVLLVLCLSLATGWEMAWSAVQRQVAQIEEEVDEDSDAVDDEATLPPARELVRALRSDAAVGEFHRYMATPGHRAFAVSNAGAWGWHAGAARPDQAIDSALADCERRRSPYTANCRLVHVNNQWAMN
ncbi:MAG TPA: DUF805 domain-containing protein [Ideonella sp.]|uniref:DUF805 domain-containing protein n=1 Tax=Ideonella sp. TaxID=1929293 RepID=UPI002E3282C4|nr:DUF805 domain-containing protein [Ideonella sp.]HEX5686413.1 DUF805 domain-containing protein [Ideonella sp.]